jgi:hypothetical protein
MPGGNYLPGPKPSMTGLFIFIKGVKWQKKNCLKWMDLLMKFCRIHVIGLL